MRWLATVIVLGLGCEKTEKAPPPPPPDPIDAIQLPDVTGAGAVPWTSTAPVLIASPTAVLVDGTQVIALRDGTVDPADKEGGALGIKVPKLSTRLGALPRAGSLAVAVDRRLTYRLLIGLLFSAKQKEAGWKRFDVLARAGGKLVAFPLVLPDKAPSRATDAGDNAAVALTDRPTIARVAVSRPTGPSGRVIVVDAGPADTVLRKIQAAYMAGIKRCYKDLLRTNATARGKLDLSINITETGALRDSSASGFAPSLDTCISAAMASWRFPIPRDADGKPTGASFRIKLQLIPDDDGAASPPAPSPPHVDAPPSPPHVDTPPPPADPVDVPLKLVVTVTKTELLLWSFTGLEGTLKEPKLRVPPTQLAKLTPALAQIASQRWGARARPAHSHTIIVMADGGISMQTIAEVFAAVRATPDGKPLFTDVQLSSGFE